MADRWYIGYIDIDDISEECAIEADSVSEAMDKTTSLFMELFPEKFESHGYSISVEKAVMTSNTIEPDYYNMTGDNKDE